MTDLIINATEDSPAVALNTSGDIKIHGRSLPEDAFHFYEPLIQWINFYCQTPANNTVFEFKLEYFNTASAKQIFKIVSFASELSKQSTVVVKWIYDEGDRDMKASGERFSKLANMPFELIQG
jgi:hypothetical protein